VLRGCDAPDRISNIVGDQQRAGLVEREPERPPARLPVRLKKTGDDVLRFAVGTLSPTSGQVATPAFGRALSPSIRRIDSISESAQVD
jgi:hypothetical protein